MSKETKDNTLHHVSVQATPVILHKDIKDKINEIRVKRDAIMLAHNRVNLDQDKYNKAIICLSLFSAFFESVKAQLNLATRNDWLAPISILMPILLSTILSIISSLMKFKKFNERIDLLSKATEKSNATVLNLRRLQESLNFQSYMQSYKDYSGSVTESYRDALDCYERALYPHEHEKYLKEATKIAKNTKEYKTDNDLLLHNNLYPNNIQLDSPDVESSGQLDNHSQHIKIKIKDHVTKEDGAKDDGAKDDEGKDDGAKNDGAKDDGGKDDGGKDEQNKVVELSNNINELYKKFEKDSDNVKLKPSTET